MNAVMVKMGDGFYIPKLEGFDDIQKDTISINVELTEEEYKQLSYKELKGIAIMERYYDKLDNQITINTDITVVQYDFRKKNNLIMDLDHYLKVK